MDANCPMTDGGITIERRIIRRSLTIWLVLIVAEIVHGVLCATALVPVAGEAE